MMKAFKGSSLAKFTRKYVARLPILLALANMMKASPYMDEKLKILENLNQSAEELDNIVHTINSTIEMEFEPVVQPASRS